MSRRQSDESRSRDIFSPFDAYGPDQGRRYQSTWYGAAPNTAASGQFLLALGSWAGTREVGPNASRDGHGAHGASCARPAAAGRLTFINPSNAGVLLSATRLTRHESLPRTTELLVLRLGQRAREATPAPPRERRWEYQWQGLAPRPKHELTGHAAPHQLRSKRA